MKIEFELKAICVCVCVICARKLVVKLGRT